MYTTFQSYYFESITPESIVYHNNDYTAVNITGDIYQFAVESHKIPRGDIGELLLWRPQKVTNLH